MSKWITIRSHFGEEKSINLDLLNCIEYDSDFKSIIYKIILPTDTHYWLEAFDNKKEFERKRSIIQRKQNSVKEND